MPRRRPAAVRLPPGPNIVWISNEDMSPQLGAYGDKLARTPVLDRLARESIRYTNAFTTAPVCAPSRAAIITGMYQTTLGAQHMRTTEDRVPGAAGAVPGGAAVLRQGVSRVSPRGRLLHDESRQDRLSVRPAVHDLGRRRAERRTGAIARTAGRSSRCSTSRSRTRARSFRAVRRGRGSLSSRARRQIEVPPYYPDTPAIREELARIYDNIADMDGQVGELLKQLEDDGLAENTIVFYWSDHGDGVPRAKRSLYDSGLRVPLMIRWPKGLGSTLTPGSVNSDLVSFVDLAPTVLALAGVEIPVHLQGRVLVGPKAGSRQSSSSPRATGWTPNTT